MHDIDRPVAFSESLNVVNLPRAMATRFMKEYELLYPVMIHIALPSEKADRLGTMPAIVRELRIDKYSEFYTRFIPLVDRPVAAAEALSDRRMEMYEDEIGKLLSVVDEKGTLKVNKRDLAYNVLTSWFKAHPEDLYASYQQFKTLYRNAKEMADEDHVDMASIYFDDGRYGRLVRRSFTPIEYIKPLLDLPIYDEKFIEEQLELFLKSLTGLSDHERMEIANMYGNSKIKDENIQLQKRNAMGIMGGMIRTEIVAYWGEDALSKLPEKAKQLIQQHDLLIEEAQKTRDHLMRVITEELLARKDEADGFDNKN